MSIQTINPANGQVIATYDAISASDIDTIIEQTQAAYLHWSQQSLAQRAEPMVALSQLLFDRKNQYAELIAMEMGKPVVAGITEIEKCAKLCRYYAEHAVDFLQPRFIKTEHQKSYVCYQALGIIFAIMPWNFPFWQVFRFAVPNLMLGNGCLLKHAPISTGTALTIESVIQEAGFTENIFRTLVITEEQSKEVIENQYVQGVTLTGSERAGKSVAALAGSAIKKSVMEMGGSDPYIILEDANLEQAAKVCMTSRMLDSIAQGAKLLCGGILPDSDGFYYPATILLDVKPGMPAYDEELFGPVVCVLRAEDEAQAISLANDTRFGLGAAVFTTDLEKGERIARDQLQAGTCNINSMVTSDPRLPFGGIKQSGYGRELAQEGMHEFANIKTAVLS